ncbi:MAG: HigA family addiction module antidote protein [Alphaproteobacteria bacterium]|nr:HigA family addiction module antidote protein [Alphaproteobacteria bacterium]
MIEYRVRHPLKRYLTHPGVLMWEILADHVRLPIAAAARRMRISRQSLYAVLDGKSAVTAAMALKFAKLTGGTPDLFLHVRDAYDLRHAQARLRLTLERIAPASSAA